MTATYPKLRMRRLRRTEPIRSMVREVRLDASDFVYPLFIVPGQGVRREIPSMPGCYHLSADEAVREAHDVLNLGIPMVILFGLPSAQDPAGSGAAADKGLLPEAIRALKKDLPARLVATDHGRKRAPTCSIRNGSSVPASVFQLSNLPSALGSSMRSTQATTLGARSLRIAPAVGSVQAL